MEEKDISQNTLSSKSDSTSIFDLAKNNEPVEIYSRDNERQFIQSKTSFEPTKYPIIPQDNIKAKDTGMQNKTVVNFASADTTLSKKNDSFQLEKQNKSSNDLAQQNKIELQKFQSKNNEIYIPELKDSKETNNLKAEEKPKTSIFKSILLILIFGILITLFFYIVLNFPALWSKLSFFYREKTGKIPEVQKIIPENTNNQDLLFLDIVSKYAPTKKLPGKATLGLSFLENNQLYIPKIDAKAPIVWDSPVDDATLMQNLKNGVVHFKETSKPGEKLAIGEGNIFISGHSSYYWWDDGKYNTIFANLENINNDDEIAIGYDDFAFVYKVVSKEVVDPNNKTEIDRVLAQNTSKQTLSLMTCVPVGTDARRLIVRSELVAIGTDNLDKVEYFIEKSKPINPSPIPTPTITEVVPKPIASPSKFPNQDSINLLPWNN